MAPVWLTEKVADAVAGFAQRQARQGILGLQKAI
jgi:hypothetical protein